MNSDTFMDVMPCNLIHVTYALQAACFFEMLLNIYHNTQCQISEDSDFQSALRESTIPEFIAPVLMDILAMKATFATKHTADRAPAHTHKICCSQKLFFIECN
jgi:hypothetical protein